MERLSHHPFEDPGTRFALDNIRDGMKDESMVLWEAHDTKEDKVIWMLGRKLPPENGEIRVLPCAILIGDSFACTKRYAPAHPNGGWDYSQIEGGTKIITP